VVNGLLNAQTNLHFTQVSADQFISPEDVGAHILEEKAWFAVVSEYPTISIYHFLEQQLILPQSIRELLPISTTPSNP